MGMRISVDEQHLYRRRTLVDFLCYMVPVMQCSLSCPCSSDKSLVFCDRLYGMTRHCSLQGDASKKVYVYSQTPSISLRKDERRFERFMQIRLCPGLWTT